MKITVLVENTSDFLPTRHGLSLYIETELHKILFDMGPDETFLQNAETLGIDLSAADIAFLSHGHYDHGGGLAAFLEINHTAKVYLQKARFSPISVRTRIPNVISALIRRWKTIRSLFLRTHNRSLTPS